VGVWPSQNDASEQQRIASFGKAVRGENEAHFPATFLSFFFDDALVRNHRGPAQAVVLDMMESHLELTTPLIESGELHLCSSFAVP